MLILHLCLGQHSIPDTSIKKLQREQIDLAPAQQYGKFFLHVIKADKTRRLPWLEFYQNIDVAVRPEVIAEYGPKQRQAANVVFSAETCDFCIRDRNHHVALSFIQEPF